MDKHRISYSNEEARRIADGMRAVAGRRAELPDVDWAKISTAAARAYAHAKSKAESQTLPDGPELQSFVAEIDAETSALKQAAGAQYDADADEADRSFWRAAFRTDAFATSIIPVAFAIVIVPAYAWGWVDLKQLTAILALCVLGFFLASVFSYRAIDGGKLPLSHYFAVDGGAANLARHSGGTFIGAALTLTSLVGLGVALTDRPPAPLAADANAISHDTAGESTDGAYQAGRDIASEKNRSDLASATYLAVLSTRFGASEHEVERRIEKATRAKWTPVESSDPLIGAQYNVRLPGLAKTIGILSDAPLDRSEWIATTLDRPGLYLVADCVDASTKTFTVRLQNSVLSQFLGGRRDNGLSDARSFKGLRWTFDLPKGASPPPRGTTVFITFSDDRTKLAPATVNVVAPSPSDWLALK